MWISKENTDPKRSLILAGGGMRVAYQAGVLVALEEAGIQFSHVDGTSGGIFNTAMLASGIEPREMAKRWRTLKIKNFISGKKFKDYLKPFFMTGYADTDNIREKVFPHLGIDLSTIQNNSTIEATFNVCNFSDKTVEAIPNQAVSEAHLLAGVSLPLMMPALQIGQDWYTDAVWIKDAHLMEAVRRQSQELWLVWAIGNTPTYYPGAFNQYVHMIEMSANGALLEEFQQIALINRMISSENDELPQKKPIVLYVIKSPDPLPLDPDLFFNRVSTRELINMGYEHTKTYLNHQIVPVTDMDKEATKNAPPGKFFSFRATFRGKSLNKDLSSNIIYYPYFLFSCTEEALQLKCYSSIYLSHLDQEIIAYEHQINCVRTKNQSLLTVESRLLIEGKEHSLFSSFTLHSPIDFLMGLEMKSCTINIENKDHTSIKSHLHQTLSDRLKACASSYVNTEQGRKGGIKTRFQMISKLMRYEV